MTDEIDSKILLAGKLCEKFKWNPDAITDVAEMIGIIEEHTIRSMTEMTNDIVNNSVELPAKFAKVLNDNWEDLLF